MEGLLTFRENSIRFIKEYETWFRIGSRFVGMMFVFTCINNSIGHFAALSSLIATVLLSLICSVIPSGFIVFITGAVCAAHMIKLSMPVGLVAAAVMLIVYLLFLKFSPRQSVILLAVPVLMQFHLHFMVPVIAGLIFTPYAIVPAAAGMFLTRFLYYCGASASLAGTGSSINYEGIITALNNIFTQTFADKYIWVYAAGAAAAIAAGYLVGRASFDHARYIGLIAAAAVEIAFVFIAGAAVGAASPSVIAGAAAGVIVGAILQFFRCIVDYSRKEYVQFEDEDYYYYVKAVPKYLSRRGGQEKKKAAGPEQAEKRD